MQRNQSENARQGARYDGIDEIEPSFAGAGVRVGIVMARFNLDICEGLLSACTDELLALGVARTDIRIVTVPGALEIPLVLQTMARSGRHDALVALGAVIRGGTPHFEYVAGECTKGIAQVSLASGLPIAFGVLTVDTIEQAIERAGTKAGNKGAEAALSALEMVSLLGRL